MAEYRLRFINDSPEGGDFIIFQPPRQPRDGFPLAWFSARVEPGDHVTFTWTLDACFVSGEADPFAPGSIFTTHEVLSATDANQVCVIAAADRLAFTPMDTAVAGLHIVVDESVPPATPLSVGIGMSGAGTFVVAAEPNTEIAFTTEPAYWIAFGEFKVGELLNPATIAATRVEFPAGVFAMTATLSSQNTWTIAPA